VIIQSTALHLLTKPARVGKQPGRARGLARNGGDAAGARRHYADCAIVVVGSSAPATLLFNFVSN
jgi:hypothetical protein